MNISKMSSPNFKGVYLSNSLTGEQRALGKQIRNLINSSGLAYEYEKEEKDIFIKEGPQDSINIATAPYNIKMLVDDRYSRWNGRL